MVKAVEGTRALMPMTGFSRVGLGSLKERFVPTNSIEASLTTD